jgi:hypothetical protein
VTGAFSSNKVAFLRGLNSLEKGALRSVDKYGTHTPSKSKLASVKKIDYYYFKNVTVFLKATTPSVTGTGQALSNATGLPVTVIVAPIHVRTVR